MAELDEEGEPIEEQDAIDCLLSWRQTRVGISKEKLNRGFSGGRDLKKLEARVRSFKRKQVGHFSRNCPKRVKGFGKGSTTSSTPASTSGGSKVNYVFMAWPVLSSTELPWWMKANEPFGWPGPPSSDDDTDAVETIRMEDPWPPPLFGHQVEALVHGSEYVPCEFLAL